MILRVSLIDICPSTWTSDLAPPFAYIHKQLFLPKLFVLGRIVVPVRAKAHNGATVVPNRVHRGIITFCRISFSD